MKISIELKDNVFEYTYNIGAYEKQTGVLDLSSEHLLVFAKVLEYCQKDAHKISKRQETALNAYYWIKQNKEEAMKIATDEV
jgi:hypothetical protein